MDNAQLGDLPENARRVVADFVSLAAATCGDNLVSIALFGSAAEGRLRPSSDVNLILVTKVFDFQQVDLLRDAFRVAHAAIRMSVMFLCAPEIAAASESFAVKFSDVQNRHRVLFGADPFKDLKISRSARIRRLQQVILNLTLRIRERYALVSLREEQLVPLISDVTGPIRASAAAILNLESGAELHPKEALVELTRHFLGHDWNTLLNNISAARETNALPPGDATSTVKSLLDLLDLMLKRIQGLS